MQVDRRALISLRDRHCVLYLALPGCLLEVPPVSGLASMVFEKGLIHLCPLDPEGSLR